ncbi:hypothetical protein C5167_029709 [Papaver somniferum]|nr:hypothetical protein C5167_029709 [Papaver somniferum]
MAQLLNVKTIFLLKRGCSTLRLLAATAVRRLQPDNEDSNGKTETEKSKKDCLMPDLCVICLEQEYNVWSYVLLYNMLSRITSCPLGWVSNRW